MVQAAQRASAAEKGAADAADAAEGARQSLVEEMAVAGQRASAGKQKCPPKGMLAAEGMVAEGMAAEGMAAEGMAAEGMAGRVWVSGSGSRGGDGGGSNSGGGGEEVAQMRHTLGVVQTQVEQVLSLLLHKEGLHLDDLSFLDRHHELRENAGPSRPRPRGPLRDAPARTREADSGVTGSGVVGGAGIEARGRITCSAAQSPRSGGAQPSPIDGAACGGSVGALEGVRVHVEGGDRVGSPLATMRNQLDLTETSCQSEGGAGERTDAEFERELYATARRIRRAGAKVARLRRRQGVEDEL